MDLIQEIYEEILMESKQSDEEEKRAWVIQNTIVTPELATQILSELRKRLPYDIFDIQLVGSTSRNETSKHDVDFVLKVKDEDALWKLSGAEDETDPEGEFAFERIMDAFLKPLFKEIYEYGSHEDIKYGSMMTVVGILQNNKPVVVDIFIR